MTLLHRAVARALGSPARGPNRDYRRAIVLSNHRSGSTMLVSAIDAHPGALCFSEVFNGGRPMFFAGRLERGSRLLQAYRDRWPREFLDGFVYGGYAPVIGVVGFKAFASQIRDPRFSRVLRATIDDPDVRRLQLIRRNKLAQYVSTVRATRSGVWSSNDGRPEEVRPIRIDAGECLATLRRLEAADRLLSAAIGEREALRLHYEEFLGDPAGAFARVRRHLDLPPAPFRPSVRRQRTISLAAAIENADEIRAALAGTPWANDLDEEATLVGSPLAG